MADRNPAPDTPELRERWGAFEFTESYRERADAAGNQPERAVARRHEAQLEPRRGRRSGRALFAGKGGGGDSRGAAAMTNRERQTDALRHKRARH